MDRLPVELIAQIVDNIPQNHKISFAQTCSRYSPVAIESLQRNGELVILYPRHTSKKNEDDNYPESTEKVRKVRLVIIREEKYRTSELDVPSDVFIEMLAPFSKLESLHIEDRAGVRWVTFLEIVAWILANQPRLTTLTLDHYYHDKASAHQFGYGRAHEFLTSGVVTKLQNLSICLFNTATRYQNLQYKEFSQLMDVFKDATSLVRTFKLNTICTSLTESGPALSGDNNISSWNLPQTQDLTLMVYGVPSVRPVISIRREYLAKVKRLLLICDLNSKWAGSDLVLGSVDQMADNLSDFVNIEELTLGEIQSTSFAWNVSWNVERQMYSLDTWIERAVGNVHLRLAERNTLLWLKEGKEMHFWRNFLEVGYEASVQAR